MKFRNAIATLMFCLCVLPVRADIIPATDMGWYDNDGLHVPEEINYAVGGNGPLGSVTHNFFVFDLGSVTDVVSATLRVLLPPADATPIEGGYSIVNDAFETWALFDIVSSITALLDGSGGIGAFEDLGTGQEYGQVDVTAAMQGTYVEVNLNAQAVASINQAGGLWGVGGKLTTITNGFEVVFGYSHLYHGAELSVVRASVSSPGTLSSVLACLFLLAWYRQRSTLNNGCA